MRSIITISLDTVVELEVERRAREAGVSTSTYAAKLIQEAIR